MPGCARRRRSNGCARLRRDVPGLGEDRYFASDMACATALVRGDALAEAAGVALPGVTR